MKPKYSEFMRERVETWLNKHYDKEDKSFCQEQYQFALIDAFNEALLDTKPEFDRVFEEVIDY